ncbi:flavo protein [Aspergillus bertholletiae]|uniref:Flavin prenyltransferase PAD1, mitochondrial n=1 Tax=Aspergillus bertholletiae TaxID=1226010 RepID=A0A5N7BEE9_9EURO|nr:flavo protein [Aspergillus bertholletiae]
MSLIGSAIIIFVGIVLYLANRFPGLHISRFSLRWDTKAPAMAVAQTNAQSTTLQNQPTGPTQPRRIIVAMTGATGAILGIRLLERLREMNIETHLVISRWAVETIKYETKYTANDVRALATRCYPVNDAGAAISSGSFQADGMIIVPCSMRTLSAVRTGFADDLICRAADVTLKEKRKLVLVVRETPLSGIHLENMLSLARYGAVIFPPMPAFYTTPETVDDIVTQSVGRMLDMFGLDAGNFERWDGF